MLSGIINTATLVFITYYVSINHIHRLVLIGETTSGRSFPACTEEKRLNFFFIYLFYDIYNL